MNYWHKILLKHRVYCELCSAPIPATQVCEIRKRPQWPETRTVVVCDAHWRANSPIEAGLQESARLQESERLAAVAKIREQKADQ